ncbi:hypothetical protein HFP15_30735 [Amycolatopsis sp. K13G38]|uniref:Secreted protein n=1 Tax=Amycolatopsis acididurans TaxID=2724524 RepID=A0ABX1JBT2_9PSEU|nr:hypothetical protein [Amycolatopsis acididurans]
MASAPSHGGRAAVFKGLGLVAVAVVAGLVWWLVRHDSGDAPVAQAPAKEFSFVATAGPVVSGDCAAKSSDSVKRWFGSHPCQRLSRSLYATSAGSARALVSVAVVTMPSEADAQELKKLVDTDGTGNVSDLVADGTAKLPDAPKLPGGEYASRVTGSQVTIVLAGFYGGHTDPPTLTRVAGEALELPAQPGK